jgi:hypothetical protein
MNTAMAKRASAQAGAEAKASFVNRRARLANVESPAQQRLVIVSNGVAHKVAPTFWLLVVETNLTRIEQGHDRHDKRPRKQQACRLDDS